MQSSMISHFRFCEEKKAILHAWAKKELKKRYFRSYWHYSNKNQLGKSQQAANAEFERAIAEHDQPPEKNSSSVHFFCFISAKLPLNDR